MESSSALFLFRHKLTYTQNFFPPQWRWRRRRRAISATTHPSSDMFLVLVVVVGGIFLGEKFWTFSFAAGEKEKRAQMKPSNIRTVYQPFALCTYTFGYFSLGTKIKVERMRCFSRLSKFSFGIKGFFCIKHFTVWEGRKSWGRHSPLVFGVAYVEKTGADFDILFRFEGKRENIEREIFSQAVKVDDGGVQKKKGEEKNLHSHDEWREYIFFPFSSPLQNTILYLERKLKSLSDVRTFVHSINIRDK